VSRPTRPSALGVSAGAEDGEAWHFMREPRRLLAMPGVKGTNLFGLLALAVLNDNWALREPTFAPSPFDVARFEAVVGTGDEN
jgi:hypothetical protein